MLSKRRIFRQWGTPCFYSQGFPDFHIGVLLPISTHTVPREDKLATSSLPQGNILVCEYENVLHENRPIVASCRYPKSRRGQRDGAAQRPSASAANRKWTTSAYVWLGYAMISTTAGW